MKEGKGDLPVACTLSGPEVAVRREELGAIFDGRLMAEELEDGFEPGGGPIRLRIRGPEGARSVVAEMFAGPATR